METIKNYIDYLKDENKRLKENIKYNLEMDRLTIVKNHINEIEKNNIKIENIKWVLGVLESKGE